MIINWKLSIGYPTATRRGHVEVQEEDVVGMTEDEKEKYIDELVWDDAIQVVETSWEVGEDEE
jgi:hypothetical protein